MTTKDSSSQIMCYFMFYVSAKFNLQLRLYDPFFFSISQKQKKKKNLFTLFVISCDEIKKAFLLVASVSVT